jgi:enoyl-[acyl-carrier-protein] reductase (NADH)
VVSDQPFIYHATKSGVNAIVRWSAAKFGPSGVSVNGLTPGSAVFKERAADFYSKNPDIVKLYEEMTPSNRMVTVHELAEVASFLLTSSPSSLTGQIIEVDGGVSVLDVVGVGKSLRNL